MPARSPLLLGGFALVLLLAVHALAPDNLRTWATDRLLSLGARLLPSHERRPEVEVVVVDIDRSSVEAVGAWPWPRLTMARLIERVAAAKPVAVGIDVLFAENDGRSPAALARQLGKLAGRPDLSALAATLPDGDAALAAAIGSAPTVLGFVLDPDGGSHLPGAAFLTTGRPALRDLWQSGGAIGPVPRLADAAAGLGTLSLPGDGDGVVRQIPLLVAVGPVVLPGVALETLRLATNAVLFGLAARPDESIDLTLNAWTIALPPGGLLRLIPAVAADPPITTLSAADILEGKASARLQGTIVLIGGSAAELGGLRATTYDPLTPSVQIQARALSQLLDDRVIVDAPHSFVVENLAALILGTVAITAAIALGPGFGVIALAAAGVVWIGGVLVLLREASLLLDPAGPVAVAASVFAVTALGSFASTRERERRLRFSFGQRLHPSVVDRLVRQPDRLKLAGERRLVTVLATDLEAFTSLTHRVEPQELISLLDRYLDGISRIVVEHGGMIDKLVGDAVHAIFNAPLDLADHASQALDAARSIEAWTKAFQKEPGPVAGEFGRTRIGLESGSVIVGDVGIGTRLDYTAYGDAMNLAVRLEGLNKQFGTSILVGPGAAAMIAPVRLRGLGKVDVRGRTEPIEVYTPAV